MLEHAAAVEVLRGALVAVDPSERLRVSWWTNGARGGWYAARRNTHDEGPVDDPHALVTLPELAAEITELRRTVTPKGTGDALCGGAWRVDDDGTFRRKAQNCAGVSLLELDVDPKGAELHQGPTLPDLVARAAALGLSIIAHPSPSSTMPARDARRFRVWVRVAVEGAAGMHFTGATDAGDLAHAFQCSGAVLRAALLCDVFVDGTTWHPGALGYVNAANAAAVGGVRTTNGAAVNPWALRDAAIAAGLWSPYVRGARYAVHGAELLRLVREVDALLPGTIGREARAGVLYVRCPDVAEHTAHGGRTPGDGEDSSCVLRTVEGLLHCSHSHGGRGTLTGLAMVKRWASLLPMLAPRLHSLWSSAFVIPDVDIAAERFVGAPGDTSDPRVAWDRAADGSALHAMVDTAAAVQDIVDDLRSTVRRWERGERTARLRVDPTGTGKSTTTAAALVAIAPELPGDTDNRPDTPRPLAVYVVETVLAARETQTRIDAAGRGELGAGDAVTAHAGEPLRRGRHGSELRAARYLPVSDVGADGRDTRLRAVRGCPKACVHHTTATVLEQHGVDARASLCAGAGTDDPRTLRNAPGARGHPCPKSSAAGGSCVAEHHFHFADGTVPQSGDAWVAVVAGDAVHAAPGVVRGGVHIVDETGRAASPVGYVIEPADVAHGSAADALTACLRGDAPGAAEPTRAAVRAVYAGVLAWLRERGPAVMLEHAGHNPEQRAESLAAWLTTWCERAEHRAAARWEREAARSWPRVLLVRDPGTCPFAHALSALDAWKRARPALANWKRATWRDGAPDVTGQVWRAVAAYLEGGTVEAHTKRDATEGAPHARVRTGGVVVHAFPSTLTVARAWPERGPVVVLDATADASMIATALGAGRAGAAVEGVRARAITLPDTATVRRMVVRAPTATRRGLLRHDKHQGGDVVRWKHPNGAASGTIVRAVVAVLLRDAPRDEGGRIAPMVLCAPRPLSLALRALYDGATVEALRDGSHPAVCDDHGKPYNDALRSAIAASVEGAAGEPAVLGALEELRAAASAVWWTWPGGSLARGSNAPHEGGARVVVTIGDGFIRPEASTLRASLAGRTGDEGVRAQQRRDAAAELAQVHGRVRDRRITGQALHVHFGTVRPWDWPSTETEVVTLDALRATFARRAAPAADERPPAAPAPRAELPELAPLLVRAVAGGWSQAAVARMTATTERTVRRWYAGETNPGAEHMAALQLALDASDDETRATYRALMLRGRRPLDLIRGKGGARGALGIIAMAAAAHGERRRGARALRPTDITPDALVSWLEGRAELPPDVVATLDAIRADMADTWGRKAPSYFDGSRRGGPVDPSHRVYRATPAADVEQRITTAVAAITAALRTPHAAPPSRAAGDNDAG